MVSFKQNSSEKIYFRRKFTYLKKTSKENKVFKQKFNIHKDCYVYIAKEDEKICKKPLQIYLNYRELQKFERAKRRILKNKTCNLKFTSQAEKEFQFLRENPQFNARTLVMTARQYNLSLNKFIDLHNKTKVSPTKTKRIFKVDRIPEKKVSIYHSSKELQNTALDKNKKSHKKNNSRTKNHIRRDFKVDRFPKKEESISHPNKEPKNANFEFPRAVLNSSTKRKEDIRSEKLRKKMKTRMVLKSDELISSQKHLESNLHNKNILSYSPLSENELHVIGVKEETHNAVIEGDTGKNVHIAHSPKHIENVISTITVSNTSEKERHLLKKKLINAELPNFILKSDSIMDTKHPRNNTTDKNMNNVLLFDPSLSENEAEACHPLNVYSKTNEDKTGVKKYGGENIVLQPGANMLKVADSLTNTHLEIFIAEDAFGNKEEGNVLTEKMNTVDLPEHPLHVFDVIDQETKFKRGDEGKISKNILKLGAHINESLPHTDIHIENQFFSSKNIYSVEESYKSGNEIISFHLKGTKRKAEEKSLHCCEENKKRRLSHLEEEYPDSEGDCEKDVTAIHHVIDNEIEKGNYSLKEINESNYFPEESESVIDVSSRKPDVSSTESMNGNSDHMLDKIKDNITLISTDDTFELLENVSTYASQTENDLPEYFLEVPSKDVCLPDDFLINEHVFETSENVSLIKDDIVPTPAPASSDVLIYPALNKNKVHVRNKSPHFKKKVAKNIELPAVFKENITLEFSEKVFNHFEDTEQKSNEEESNEDDIFPFIWDNEFLNRLNNFFRAILKKVPKEDRPSLRQEIVSEMWPVLSDIEHLAAPPNIGTLLTEMYHRDVATLQDQVNASPPGENDASQAYNNISFPLDKLEDDEIEWID